MVYSTTGYCVCGAEIWIEYIQAGDGWAARFLDDGHQEITECPECGRALQEDDLESR